jgi:hypothetical protein
MPADFRCEADTLTNIASPANFFTSPARSSTSVADEFAFSIFNLPAFLRREYRKARCKPDHVE